MNKTKDSNSDQFAARLKLPPIQKWPKSRRRVVRPPKPKKERSTKAHSLRQRKHDPEELYAMYQTQTLSQIAQVKGVSTERIRQILRDAGYSTKLHIGKRGGSRKYIPIEQIIDLRKQGLTIAAISREVGLSTTTIWTHLRRANVVIEVDKPLTPIGCARCIARPLARGLCHNCYHKWLKRGKPEGVARPKVLMPIGCEDCKTRPFVKGLCRKCYSRKWDREKRARIIMTPERWAHIKRISAGLGPHGLLVGIIQELIAEAERLTAALRQAQDERARLQARLQELEALGRVRFDEEVKE